MWEFILAHQIAAAFASLIGGVGVVASFGEDLGGPDYSHAMRAGSQNAPIQSEFSTGIGSLPSSVMQ